MLLDFSDPTEMNELDIAIEDSLGLGLGLKEVG